MAERMTLRWILADLVLLVGLGWAMQHSDGQVWHALFVIMLGLNAIWFGVEAIRKREDFTYGSEEGVEAHISTRRGWTAVLSGSGLAVAGGLLVVSGLAMLVGLGKALLLFIQEHGRVFIGFGGVWLAAFGLLRMVGDIESHDPNDSHWFMRQVIRLSGLPAMLGGVVMAIAGFLGYLPWLGWIR